MPETDYPEVLIVESDVPCPVLDQLPRLPVRIHVLDARGELLLLPAPQPFLAKNFFCFFWLFFALFCSFLLF